MSESDMRGHDQPPASPSEQIRAAFELAATEPKVRDFDWLVAYLNREGHPYVRLVQFTVSRHPGDWIYIVLHVQASHFGELVQEFEENRFRVPYCIRVLSRFRGSDERIGVSVTYGPGGGR